MTSSRESRTSAMVPLASSRSIGVASYSHRMLATSGSRIALSYVCSSVSPALCACISIKTFCMLVSSSRECYSSASFHRHELTAFAVSISVAFCNVSKAPVRSFIVCWVRAFRMYALMNVGSTLMACSASLKASGRARSLVYAAARLLYPFGSSLIVCQMCSMVSMSKLTVTS